MSHQKAKHVPNCSQALFDVPAFDVDPKERERVEQFIAANKSGPALDLAKEIHRRCHSATSEALLLDAYGARVLSLVERKLDRDAKALMDLVRERYPSARDRLREWDAVLAVRRGNLAALLEPLNDPALPAEKQAAIFAGVRRDVFDLRALAQCPALAPEHPLRAAATALYEAFEAVTSGPVADEALALPQISRSSPLAPWKMLVRAIAAFYRRDDQMCEKCLAMVDPDSAAASLVPAIRALTHPSPTLTSPLAALVKQVGGSLDSLRAALKRLDAALDRGNHSLVLQEIRPAVAACRDVAPDLLARLQQHISVRSKMAGLNPDKVAAALDGPTVKNAAFWRLLARAFEEDRKDPMAIGLASSAWEQFRKHAVREGWFPAQGPEVATLYLHMADLLQHVGPEEQQYLYMGFARGVDNCAIYYRDQPPEIRALMPNRGNPDLSFLSQSSLFEKACEADPCSENFARWLQSVEIHSGVYDRVAERWAAAQPKDSVPWLYLMQSAEKRDALQMAFKYMEQAERIDGVNAEVRRARLRLLVSIAVKHLRQKKAKLADKDLRQIEELPQAQQGDRPAFVAALRYVASLLGNAQQDAAAAYDDTVRFLGDAVTAHLLFLVVEHWCGQRASGLPTPERPTVPLYVAWGRVCALGDDMGMTVEMIDRMPEQIMKELSAPNLSADPRILAALGESAMRADHLHLAYAVAGAGLAQSAESQARFLFLRARSLPPWVEERRSSCVTAASDLARRRHDTDLLRRIGDWRDEVRTFFDPPEEARAALSAEEIDRVVRREIEERAYPTSRPDLPPDEDCDCPACRAERDGLPAELVDMIDEFGPEVVARAMSEMLGIGRKKKRGRRHSEVSDADLPF
jgi:hypothetical protein